MKSKDYYDNVSLNGGFIKLVLVQALTSETIQVFMFHVHLCTV